MQNFLAKQNEELPKSEWKITCELFAPYAPEENPVEAIWFKLKSLLRNFIISAKILRLLIFYFNCLLNIIFSIFLL
jgi:transposase